MCVEYFITAHGYVICVSSFPILIFFTGKIVAEKEYIFTNHGESIAKNDKSHDTK